MNDIDVLQELNQCNGYETALLSTYSCDINFINRMITSNLIDKGCNKIILFVDKRMFINFIKEESCKVGNKYIINTINTENAFHPKTFLFLGKENAKLIVGSGNLTSSGMINNHEIFSKFEYNKENKENLVIIQKAFSMFIGIKENNPFPLQDRFFALVDKYDYLKISNDGIRKTTDLIWIDNITDSISMQISDIIDDNILSYDIIAPFFDKNCDAVNELSKIMNVDKYRIFVQNHKSNLKPENLTGNNDVYTFDRFNNEYKYYHAKVFIFYGEHYDYVLYGSANCSKQALLRDISTGNYEACILEKGNKGCFDYYIKFINQYNKLDINEFKSIDTKSSNNSDNIIFEYSVLRDDKIKIKLKQKNNIKIEKIFINDILVTFVEKEGDIDIEISFDIFIENLESSIFSVTIKEAGSKEYSIWGWYLNEAAIMYTQDNKKEIIWGKIRSGEWDTDLAFVIEIINEFQENVIWNNSELMKSINYIRRKQLEEYEMNEELNDNPEEYIVEIVEKEFHNSFNNNPFNIVSMFFNKSIERHSQNSGYKKSIDVRKITTVEYDKFNREHLKKQINRLLRTYYQSLNDEEFIIKDFDETFVKRNLAIFEFVYKLIGNEHYKNLYENDYNKTEMPLDEEDLVNMYVGFLETIDKYEKGESFIRSNKNNNNILCGIAMFSIIWLYHKSKFLIEAGIGRNEFIDKEYENKSKKILNILRKFIDNDEQFRDEYMSMKNLLNNFEYFGVKYSEKDIHECFEELFDYESVKTANEKIANLLNENIKFEYDEHECILIITLDQNKEINIKNGTLRKKILKAIKILRKANMWKNKKSITFKYFAKKGNIIEYKITEYLSKQDLSKQEIKEEIKYSDGGIGVFDI